MFYNIGLILFKILDFFVNSGKYISYWLVITTPDPVQKRMSGFYIQLNGGNTRAILAPVMLFFHEQVQLI